MAGHYECIGVPPDEEAVLGFLEVAGEQGASRELADGNRELVWRDSSGASVALETASDGGIVCARPSFLGTSRLPVRVSGIAEDAACRFCSRLLVEVLGDEGEMQYPLAVELEEIGAVMSALEPDEAVRTLRVTAFAQSIRIWPDEAAYTDDVPAGTGAPDGDSAMPLAPRSLIPVGLFVEPERRGIFRRRVERAPTAEALLTGIVNAFGERRNTVTGDPFLWAELETFGGRFDAVIAASEGDGLTDGAVVQLESWLIASLDTG